MFKTIKCFIKQKQLFRYIEYSKLYVKNSNVIIEQNSNKQILPIASIASIIIGKGVSITHDVFTICSKYNCIINFVSNNGFVYHASCLCPTHNNYNLLKQINHYSNDFKKENVIKKLIYLRFDNLDIDDKNIWQILGLQAVRVKKTYKQLSSKYNVTWNGRQYSFQNSSNVNKYITIFNSFLYATINTIILSLGYQPRLGFIHNASPLALTYDISDVFKKECSIQLAFQNADKQFDYKNASELFYVEAMKINLIKKAIETINYIFE